MMSEEEQEEEDLDFLLNPELVDRFKLMFERRLEATKTEKEEIDNAQKNITKTITNLEDKLEILTKYSEFIKAKGFGYCKQEADSYFEEMKNAEKDRLPTDFVNSSQTVETPRVCGEYYLLTSGEMFQCKKNEEHNGSCGP